MTDALEVTDLHVRLRTAGRQIHAVNGVSFRVPTGTTLGIVGESGSGKSITALSIMGLLPPVGAVESGSIRFAGRELVGLGHREMSGIRGQQMAMIYQDPMSSLNPTMTVGRQITNVLRHHLGMSRVAARARAVELLADVNLPNPAGCVDRYPHQFSGGQRQRILIALALACGPSLLIADEPTTALDVTVQAQIIELMKQLRVAHAMSMVWITHDLGVLAGLVDHVLVMYAGTVVELAPVRELFATPSHPYTRALLAALPARNPDESERLVSLAGQPPDQLAPINGCPFASRCIERETRCTSELPVLVPIGDGHRVACLRRANVDESVAS